MIHQSADRCFSFIHGQVGPTSRPSVAVATQRAVTISRQAGCGGLLVANKLSDFLRRHTTPDEPVWTIFDRDLMGRVLAEHDLPDYLKKYLPEDRISMFEDTLADIFGMRPTSQTVVEQTAETILRLATLGHVILIGRAGNIVTARLPHVLHVRLVAPLEDRIERICRDDKKTPDEARKFCLEEEQARARYVKTYYHANIDDPLLYDLTINTSSVGYEETARLVGEAVLHLD